MRVLSWIFLGLVAFVSLFSLFVPKNIEIKSCIVSTNEQETLFDQINTITNWAEASELNKIDPYIIFQYPRHTKGVGAKLNWNSNNSNIGNGKVEFIEVNPSKDIQFIISMDNFIFIGLGEIKLEKINTEEIEINLTLENKAVFNPIARILSYFVIRPKLSKKAEVFLQNLDQKTTKQ